MNKPAIIINGIKAAEFKVVNKHKAQILNNLIYLLDRYDPACPKHRTKVEIPSTKFNYDIGDKYMGNRKIIWRGFYIYPDSTVIKIYIKNNFIIEIE